MTLSSRSDIIAIVALFSALLGSTALSAYLYYFRALRNLSPKGQGRFWSIMTWGVLVFEEDDFTSAGWRYVRLSLQALLLPIPVLIVIAVATVIGA